MIDDIEQARRLLFSDHSLMLIQLAKGGDCWIITGAMSERRGYPIAVGPRVAQIPEPVFDALVSDLSLDARECSQYYQRAFLK